MAFDEFLTYYSIFIIFVSAAYVGLQLRNHADGVQRALMFGLIWGCGPRLFNYSLLDEIVLLIVSGYMWLFRRRELWFIVKGLRHNPIYWMPTIFCLFLALHSLFSLFFLADLRMMKWTLVFGAAPFIIALIPRWLSGRDTSNDGSVRFVLLHLHLYFTAYISQGILGEFLIGDWGRFHTQDTLWQGSSLAIMPVVSFFAACYFLPERLIGKWQNKLYFGLLISFCSFFFDSRIMQLLLMCCPIAGFFLYWRAWRQWTAILVAFTCCFFLNVTIDNHNVKIKKYVTTIWESVPPEETLSLRVGKQKRPHVDALAFGLSELVGSANVINPLENDVDRMLQLEAGYAKFISANMLQKVLGTGFYTHRYEIGYIVNMKYKESLPGLSGVSLAPSEQDKSKLVFRTTAMAGYLIDTGLLGIVLLGLTLISAVYFAVFNGVQTLLAGGTFSVIALAWTYSNYSLENVLWFLIMFIVTGICRQSEKIVPDKMV